MNLLLFIINVAAVAIYAFSPGTNQSALNFAFASVFWGICLLVHEATMKTRLRMLENQNALLSNQVLLLQRRRKD